LIKAAWHEHLPPPLKWSFALPAQRYKILEAGRRQHSVQGVSCPSRCLGERRARHQESAPELLEPLQFLGRLTSDSSGVNSSSSGRRVTGYGPLRAAGTESLLRPEKGSDPAS